MAVLVLAAAALAVLYWFLVASRHRRGFPPGPGMSLPVLGDSLAIGQNLPEGFNNLHKKYGKVVGLWLGPVETVSVNDFDLIHEVGSRDDLIDRPEFEFFAKFRGGYGCNKPLPGVLFSSGQTWLEQRRYTMHKLKDLGFGKNTNEQLVTDEVAELNRALERTGGKAIGVRNEFNLAIVNALWTLLTGERLEHGNPKARKVTLEMDRLIQEFGNPITFLVYFYRPLSFLMDTFNLGSGGEAARGLVDLIDDSVKQSKASFPEDGEASNFSEHYLQEIRKKTSEGAESTFSGVEGALNMKNVLLDLFMAGSETTSTTLTWGMLFMLLHPDIMKKVQAELDTVFGVGQVPRASERERTPYTEAVIHEIQRRGNITPLSVVHAASRDTHLNGHLIPKGTQIFCNIGAVMMNPLYFMDPDKFDPERYLQNGKFVPHPKMVTFGLGRRRCLGETLARMELYMFFTGILSRFDLRKETPEASLTTKPRFGSVLSPQPFKIRFVSRY